MKPTTSLAIVYSSGEVKNVKCMNSNCHGCVHKDGSNQFTIAKHTDSSWNPDGSRLTLRYLKNWQNYHENTECHTRRNGTKRNNESFSAHRFIFDGHQKESGNRLVYHHNRGLKEIEITVSTYLNVKRSKSSSGSSIMPWCPEICDPNPTYIGMRIYWEFSGERRDLFPEKDKPYKHLSHFPSQF